MCKYTTRGDHCPSAGGKSVVPDRETHEPWEKSLTKRDVTNMEGEPGGGWQAHSGRWTPEGLHNPKPRETVKRQV